MHRNPTQSKQYNLSRRGIILCLLMVLSLVAFWPVQHHGFINFDDSQYVYENPRVRSGVTPSGIWWALTTTHASNWHPLTWMSHMADVTFFGLNPGAHHLTSLCFHILNTLLLFRLLFRTTGAFWSSGLTAALFALHPLHVEPVAWVAERKEVLSAFFWMLTLTVYVRYTERPGCLRYFGIVFIFLLGLMAKPMLVTLPFVLLLFDFWPLGRIPIADPAVSRVTRFTPSVLGGLVWEKAPLFALSLISCFITFFVQRTGGAVRSLDAYPLVLRMGNALVSYAGYLGKTIWPVDLAVFYPHPHAVPLWQVLGSAGLLLVITLWVFSRWRQHPYALVGWLWYLGTLVPVVGIIQVGSQAMADRYTYIPLIGVFVMGVWTGADVVRRFRIPITVTAVFFGSLLLALTFSCRWQVQYWKDSISLFTHTLEVTRNNYVVHNNLGLALADRKQYTEAIAQYRAVLDIKPRYKKSRNNLGVAFAGMGDFDAAIQHYRLALEIDPNYAGAHFNLGHALVAAGRADAGIAHYRIAMKLDPANPDVLNNLGVVLVDHGRTVEAIAYFTRALAIRPDAQVENNLGVALYRSGRIPEAQEHVQRSLSLDPDYASAADNLRKIRGELKKIHSELAILDQAVKKDPKDAEIRARLAALKKRTGDLAGAADHYQRAVELKPDAVEYLDQLAMIRAMQGRYDDALAVFEQILVSSPNPVNAYYKIAALHAQQNQTDEAVTWLKKAVSGGFRNWALLETDTNLASIRKTPYYRMLMEKR
jgi:protein O-mannosyl-transferase